MSTIEVDNRKDLINILLSYFKDPETSFQYTDFTTLEDIGITNTDKNRILSHFPFRFRLESQMTLWKAVDYITRVFPNWPNNCGNADESYIMKNTDYREPIIPESVKSLRNTIGEKATNALINGEAAVIPIKTINGETINKLHYIRPGNGSKNYRLSEIRLDKRE